MGDSDRIVLFLAWPQFDALECRFWQQLRDRLAQHQLRLVLASTATPPVDLDVVHVPAVPSIDAVWSASTMDVDVLGLDPDALLAREVAWGSPAVLPEIEAHRRRAMEATSVHWLHTLAVLQPDVVVLWNGQHVTELILDAAARAGGVPVLYVERAPIPQALFADERGLSAASKIAGRPVWSDPAPEWYTRADAVIRRMAAGQHTWWEQPDSQSADAESLRTHLGIPSGVHVVLFAGQVNEDTQQFLFSPRFGSNVDAFVWLLDQLRGRRDVYILGKHHPKSRTPPDEYRRALAHSGIAGAWRVDLAIDDALTVADRVAAVNSTVLYEALARQRPVLALGQWLLGGRGAAYEADDPTRDTAVVRAWLDAADAAERQHAWRTGLAVLLSTSIYTYPAEGRPPGSLGAADLAERIARLTDGPLQWHMPSAVRHAWLAGQARGIPPWRCPDDPPEPTPESEWRRAHTLRFQLMEAVRAAGDGRRIVVWGTGLGGRLAAAHLDRVGVSPAAFVASTPDGPTAHGRPLVAPDALASDGLKVFVLVASTAAPQIVQTLDALGFTSGDDYQVLDCDYLPATRLA